MGFDLENYEPVQDRIDKFYKKYPDGRIITELVKHSEDFTSVIFSAMLYKDSDIVPVSTGWAMEISGEGYVNKTSHLENCETSAIGRALANIGLHGGKRPSKEEMQGVQQNGNKKSVTKQNGHESITGETNKGKPFKTIGDVGKEYWDGLESGKETKKPVQKIDKKWYFVEYIKDMGEEVKDAPEEKGSIDELF